MELEHRLATGFFRLALVDPEGLYLYRNSFYLWSMSYHAAQMEAIHGQRSRVLPQLDP